MGLVFLVQSVRFGAVTADGVRDSEDVVGCENVKYVQRIMMFDNILIWIGSWRLGLTLEVLCVSSQSAIYQKCIDEGYTS